MALRMDDGTEREFGPGETFHMPPGHDAWIVGNEACVLLDFGGLKGYAQGKLSVGRCHEVFAGVEDEHCRRRHRVGAPARYRRSTATLLTWSRRAST
jgi:hypothetical protein